MFCFLLLFCFKAGTGTVEEHGRLGLGRDQNFCMGGPGVILSAAALKQLRPHIKTCLKVRLEMFLSKKFDLKRNFLFSLEDLID